MKSSGVIEHLRNFGVEYLHITGIDNILAKLGDPLLFGYLKKQNLDMLCKFSQKAFPFERVGVHAKLNDEVYVLEYSVIGEDLAQKTDESTGQLLYNHAHLLNFAMRLNLIDEVLSEKNRQKIMRSFNNATKSIEIWDSSTKLFKQTSGLKFEIFIFEAFKFCSEEKFGLLEVNRSHEFAPIKNASGSPCDTPESALALYSSYHAYLLQQRGWTVVGDYGTPGKAVSIHADTSYDGEGIDETTDTILVPPVNFK
jgi:UDP-N-acetylglucosamine/UDP-N-acetylgalactosamine diphosphorylase